MLFDIAILICP